MIIATRILRLMGDEHDVDVPVTIHMPVEDDRSWRCDYEIGWPRADRKSRAFGADGVQALQLAMFSIGIDLRSSPYHHAGLLILEDTHWGYGFPAEIAAEAGREEAHRPDWPPFPSASVSARQRP